jgi:type IV pilus assembly protein PilC
MPVYKYKAIARDGRSVRGRIDAANDADLELRVAKMELELVSHAEAKSRTGVASRQKITRRDLITFCYHMEQLSRSGVPIVDGLIDLRDSLDNLAFREVIAGVIQAIESGKTLSAALGDYPRVFDEVFAQLIRAGEESGKLPDVLKNITENLKWQDELAAQTKKILMYPAFVGAVVIGVIFFLMIYLVPQLVSFIKNTGNEIPIHTKILIVVSDAFVNYWYVILLTPVVIVAAVKFAAKRSEKVRIALDGMKLRVWVVGPILRKIILTRFANYFALLYGAGITILACMQITEKITGNLVIMRALAEARQKIGDGNSLSAAMDSMGLFPPLVVRMLKVGESTGGLDSALLNISYFYNRDVNESIEKAQSMIEPVLTVVLGLMLGWIMLSVLGPIYDIISKIKA